MFIGMGPENVTAELEVCSCTFRPAERPHPYSTAILEAFPLQQLVHIGVTPSTGLKLFGREIIFEVFQPV